MKQSSLLHGRQTEPDWDDITARLNAKFGGPKRTKKLLLCALEGQRQAFMDALWVFNREMEEHLSKAGSDGVGDV